MNRYTFRVTQPLVGYYEADVTINAKSEEEARNILENMSQNELEEICENWDQVSEDMNPHGDIEIHNLITEMIYTESKDFQLDYKDLSELSYKDEGIEYITLFHNNKELVDLEVFTDHENEEREYILINHEIVYLDTIKEL